MRARRLAIATGVVALAVGAALYMRGDKDLPFHLPGFLHTATPAAPSGNQTARDQGDGEEGGGGRRERAVAVETAEAVRKALPVVLEALGTVTPMASVNIKSRLDSEISSVNFADGAEVKEGDTLFVFDSRSIEAQIKQVEGTLARDRAQLAGAERDVRRYTELVEKNATPITNRDNALTQADVFRANVQADQAVLENLKVQLSYATIRAPIAGRMSSANAKVGSVVRQADVAPLATIIQTAPIYVTFPIPQRYLPQLRTALDAKTATLVADIPGERRNPSGVVVMIENTVDTATGMVTVRAAMPNAESLLWPGALVNTRLTLRSEEGVAVPAQAVQVSQTGTYVFVVKDGKAQVVPVKVARVVDGQSVVESGLSGGETVVTQGQLQLTSGVRVTERSRKVQS